jgi:hypothetical protein
LRKSRPVTAAAAFLPPREELHVRRHVLVVRLERTVPIGEWPLINERQLELRGGPDDFLGAAHVLDARELHQDLVRAAVAGDDRFGHAQLVDTTFDRLERLGHRLIAQLNRDVGLHAIRVAARLRRPVIVGIRIDCRRPEPAVVLNPFNPELGGADHVGRRELHARPLQRFPQALDRRFRLDPQRIVGVHTKHEVDAALQVETKLDLRGGRIKRPDRQADHDRDQDDSPADVFHG